MILQPLSQQKGQTNTPQSSNPRVLTPLSQQGGFNAPKVQPKVSQIQQPAPQSAPQENFLTQLSKAPVIGGVLQIAKQTATNLGDVFAAPFRDISAYIKVQSNPKAKQELQNINKSNLSLDEKSNRGTKLLEKYGGQTEKQRESAVEGSLFGMGFTQAAGNVDIPDIVPTIKYLVNLPSKKSQAVVEKILPNLNDGKNTPDEIIGAVIKSEQENTKEGKAFIKTAMTAKNNEMNIIIEKPKSKVANAGLYDISKEANKYKTFDEFKNAWNKVYNQEKSNVVGEQTDYIVSKGYKLGNAKIGLGEEQQLMGFLNKSGFKTKEEGFKALQDISNSRVAQPTIGEAGKVLNKAVKSTDELLTYIDRQGFRTPEQIAKLKQDIIDNGIKYPVELIDHKDGTFSINDGTHRIQIAKDLGIKEVPVKVVSEQPKLSPESVKPVEKPIIPKPEQKQSRVFERLQKDHPELLKGELPYDKAVLKTKFDKAAKLIAKDKQEAFDIAMGAKSVDDIESVATNIEMAEKALEEGNNKLYEKLIRNRSIAQTKRGQALVAEKASIEDNSTSRYVKELLSTRLDSLGKRYLSGLKEGESIKKNATRIIEERAGQLETRIKKGKLDVKTALSLLDELTCV